jgi:CDP-glycerol glycerophosphotransferase (TagB/SpsB family)
VASFSFGAGNAGKLLRIPLYLIGRAATLAIPRTRTLWVFGCAIGLADGAWELWEHATARGERAVWLTGTDAEAREAAARGIPSAPKGSLRGFWLTARAAVIVVTHGFGDVNRYAATGGVIVQLWHGIPLKRIGLDAAVTTASPLPFARRALAALYRRTQGRIRVLPAASEVVRGRLESAFGLQTARVPVTGEPRVDVLSRGTADGRRQTARARLRELAGPLGEGERVVLYAPTWRDGKGDPGAPTTGDISALHALLEDSRALLLIRSHHLGVGSYRTMLGARVRLLGSDVVNDITPLLPGFDALITDYSSLAFDAGLIPLPTLFLAPDLGDYARTRGFYGTYAEVAGGDPARDWRELRAQLGAVLSDPAAAAERAARAGRLGARIHRFADGQNTARVYRSVRALLPPTRTEPTSPERHP